MNIKNNLILMIACCTVINTFATNIWLENDSQKPIFYQYSSKNPFTSHEPTQLGHANRVNLGSFNTITFLSIKTQKSSDHNLSNKIKDIVQALNNKSQSLQQDAIITILPSPIIWNIKVTWENGFSANIQARNEWNDEQIENPQNLKTIFTFIRLNEPEKLLEHIVNNKIFGQDYAEKTYQLYQAALFNHSFHQLYYNLIGMISSIKQKWAYLKFDDLSHHQLTELSNDINNIKKTIAQNHLRLIADNNAGLVRWQ